MEKYSVLMSLYIKENADYFKLSLDSMLNQTIKPDEIIVVKDGPLTDELIVTIKNYCFNYPEIIKVVNSETNLGLGKALNLGLKYCKNELVARMDTDDISLPTRCEKQLAAFEKNKNLVIVGAMVNEFVHNPNQIISSRVVPTTAESIYTFAKRRSAFNHPTVMYKKSKVLACGGYSNLKRNQDVDLFGRMLFNGCIAENLDEVLLLFRSNEQLLKRRKSWENTKSYIKTIYTFWKMNYASFKDFFVVALAQIMIFLCPAKLQNWIYKKFLRG